MIIFWTDMVLGTKMQGWGSMVGGGGIETGRLLREGCCGGIRQWMEEVIYLDRWHFSGVRTGRWLQVRAK
jgi:hypothetical protein